MHVGDWMPTFMNLIEAEPQQDPRYDGQDVWSLLTSGLDSLDSRLLYWNCRGGRVLGIRHADWKLI